MRQDTAQGQDRIADAVRTAAQRRSRLDAFEVLTNRRTAGLLERLQQLLGDAGRTGCLLYTSDIRHRVCTPANAYLNHPLLEQKLKDLEAYGNTCPFNKVEMAGSKRCV